MYHPMSGHSGHGGSSMLMYTKLVHHSLSKLTIVRIRMIVVKTAIAYRDAYEPIASKIIKVDTPGLTTVNPLHFTYNDIRRPLFPLD